MKHCLLLISLISLLVRAQTPCEGLSNKLYEWQTKHHKVLSEMRYVRNEPEYAERYIHSHISEELYDNNFSLSDVLTFEKCGYIADLNLAYDEYSHHRVLQLLKNEFDEGELDTLIKYNAYISAKRVVSEELWKKYHDSKFVNSILHDKNGTIYNTFLDSLTEARKTIERDLLLHTYRFDLGSVIELAGYLNCDSLEGQLIKMHEDSLLVNFKTIVSCALVRHKVEPYYSMFIQDNRYDEKKDAEALIEKLYKLFQYAPCQETMLLAKDFLMSDRFYVLTTADGTDPYDWYVRDEAFNLLRLHLTNNDFIQIYEGFGNLNHITKEESQQLINWLNANYGKYEIRRFW